MKIIADRIVGSIDENQVGGRKLEPILMDRGDLTRPHQRVISEAGTTVGISLSRGEELYPGAILYEDDDRIVYVELEAERALVIRPEGNVQWARAAYNVGNMHQSAYVSDECIAVPYDGILEGIMKKLGILCSDEVIPLEGIRAGVSAQSGHGHSHSHDWEHDREHGHGDAARSDRAEADNG